MSKIVKIFLSLQREWSWTKDNFLSGPGCVNAFNTQCHLCSIVMKKAGTHLTTSEGEVDLCEQVRVPPQYLAQSKSKTKHKSTEIQEAICGNPFPWPRYLVVLNWKYLHTTKSNQKTKPVDGGLRPCARYARLRSTITSSWVGRDNEYGRLMGRYSWNTPKIKIFNKNTEYCDPISSAAVQLRKIVGASPTQLENRINQIPKINVN